MRRHVTMVTAIGLAFVACEKRGAVSKSATQGPVVSVSHAQYLANAGVMVVRGDTKVLFDPLFREHFGSYQPLSEKMRRDLIAGNAPFDGVSAVFISHHHGDHFDPNDIAALLRAQPKVKLYAPAQAVDALPELGDAAERVTSVALSYPDKAWTHTHGTLAVEAVRIPHAGWPEPSRAAVENLAFRVTLDAKTTVLHLGDADTKDKHFAHNPEHWAAREIHMAFPPYWYFSSDNGRAVLETRIRPKSSIGVHVPVKFRDPGRRPAELKGRTLFTEPGERHPIPNP